MGVARDTKKTKQDTKQPKHTDSDTSKRERYWTKGKEEKRTNLSKSRTRVFWKNKKGGGCIAEHGTSQRWMLVLTAMVSGTHRQVRID